MAFRIYTKTGDKGMTSLIGGTKVPKAHLRIEAYGTIDELNSYIGLCRDSIAHESSRDALREIQDRLFTIGSHLATDPGKKTRMAIPDFHETDLSFLEKEIDGMDDRLPDMKSFILPGGHTAVSHIHIARCICRRAERCCVRLQEEGEQVEAIILQYINRLSDYLFILARFIGQEVNAAEIPWKPRV